jgi:hypothetical protein
MTRALVVLALVALIAGCGGTENSSRSTSTINPGTTTNAGEVPGAALEHAVRTALSENARVSRYVGWRNRVPAWATQSTRGAALQELRQSAIENGRAGVRVRFIRSHISVVAIQIDPSYMKATATVTTDDRARVYRKNRPKAGTVTLREHARIELHRLGSDDPPRFVVWQVRLLR